MSKSVLILLVLLERVLASGGLRCLDENQLPVDWLYMYKLPKQVSPHGDGLDLLYLHKRSSGWQMSNRTIDDSQSIPGSLISRLSTEHLIIMYNDEPPEQKSDEARGHTKGVIAADATGGFWLVHSVPKFPPSDYKAYSYPPTGHLYGQSFLCISLSASELDTIGELIRFNEPHVYLGQVPTALQPLYPNLLRVAESNSSWVTEPPFFKTNRVGNFSVFSKSHKFNKELYVDWVAPTLQSDLMVESWLHGPGVINSECDKPFK